LCKRLLIGIVRRVESPSELNTMTRSSRSGAVTAVVCLALAAVVAAMASLNVALPDIARDTHATQTELVWVIDAYSLAFAVLLLPGGALGDRYGRRFALLAGLLIFGGGSAIAMTAGSAGQLIALRAVMGVGAALVMPATLSTITSTFPPAERTRAVSIWAAVAAAGAIVGLLASGALLAVFSWESVFGLNVLLSVLAIAGTLRFVPESAAPEAPHLDPGGTLLAVLGLVALVFSVIEAPNHGWLAARTVVGLILAFGLIAGFVLWELRQAAPLLDPRVFRQRRLTAGSTSIFIQFFAFYGFTFVFLQYQQFVRGHTPLLAAVQVLPLAATLIPASRLAPMLTARFGMRPICASGLALVAAGLALLSRLDGSSPYLAVAAGLLVLGAGMGLAMTPATSAITEGLPAAKQGVGSALNDLSREVGGAIGIAVVGSILAAVYSANVETTGLSAETADRVKSSFAVAEQLPPPIPDHAQTAFIDGMHISLLAAAGAALAASAIVALLLARPSETKKAGHTGDSAGSASDEVARAE
jgi:EmrB/QacA subfamily drug resistance transporter